MLGEAIGPQILYQILSSVSNTTGQAMSPSQQWVSMAEAVDLIPVLAALGWLCTQGESRVGGIGDWRCDPEVWSWPIHDHSDNNYGPNIGPNPLLGEAFGMDYSSWVLFWFFMNSILTVHLGQIWAEAL